MIVVTKNRRVRLGGKRLATAASFLAVALALKLSGYGMPTIISMLALLYLLMTFAVRPSARVIARAGVSVRWKFEAAIAVVSVLFLIISLINFQSMAFMHRHLHEIQVMWDNNAGPTQVREAIDRLEDTQHSTFFRLTPVLSLLGVVLEMALGAALAWCVVDPLRRMGGVMRGMGRGDYSQTVVVENKDELGELSGHINHASHELARLQEATQSELRGARLIQRTLLPKETPKLPGWEMAAYYKPARAVGGDFYDFLNLPDGRLGVVTGDVADKGVPAALVMATTRTALRGIALAGGSPAAVLGRVNEMLYPEIPPNMFVTCQYAILEPASGKMVFANAGHSLPYRHVGAQVEELRATGMPLGLMPDVEYDDREFTLGHGESVLFHSDGLVEAHSPGGEMFGFPRLRRLLGERPAGMPVIDFVLAGLAAFAGAEWEQEDDVTLLAIRRRAPDEVKSTASAAPAEPDHARGRGPARVIVEFELRSEQGNERQAVERVAEAVRDVLPAGERLERLKTAVAEATMNAMEHGNKYRADALVGVRVAASHGALSVLIRDEGEGGPIPEAGVPDLKAKLSGSQSPRGWGLFLIKNMVDEVHVGSEDGRHTLELVVYLGKGDQDGSKTL